MPFQERGVSDVHHLRQLSPWLGFAPRHRGEIFAPVVLEVRVGLSVAFVESALLTETHSVVSILLHNSFRTPVLNSDEILAGDPCSILERYLPNGGHELIFGSQSAPADKAQAAKTASTRRIPLVSVYIVSTNPDNEAGVEFLFRDIPCRMFRLKASDFFSEEQGAYEGMGIDRLANVKAASKFYNYPLMVMDGGTAMTYTAADAKGNIVGGGIYPGFAAMYRSMHDYTGALPLVSQEDINNTVNEAAANKKPLPVFATDTKTAMITTGLKAMSEVCWAAVDSFKEQVLKYKEENPVAAANASEADNGKDDNKDRLFTICLTGGDGDVIAKLLDHDHGHIVASVKGPEAREGIEVQKHKHLTHYGIGQVLDEKTSAGQALQSEIDRVREEIVGQRVAKEFVIRKETKTFRGSVAAVAAGKSIDEDWFYIRYDDGDTEHLTVASLYGKRSTESLAAKCHPPFD
jgi:pantothenate kinase type III